MSTAPNKFDFHRVQSVIERSRFGALAVLLLCIGSAACGGRCECDGLREVLSGGNPLRANLGPVTPSSATLQWAPVEGVTSIRVLVAPEPRFDSQGRVLEAHEVATLPPSATEYRLDGLAPGTDLFVQLEMDTPEGLQRAFLHERLPRSASTVREPTLRAVHAMAPDVLMLVGLAGRGEQWQSGPWSLHRRNGSEIGVVAVHRQTVPAAQPDYDLGQDAPNDINAIVEEHRIYLRLSEPLGSRDMLRLAGPYELQVLIPYSDLFLETPVIQLNQVGYNPEARRRYAYVSGWLGDGGPLSLEAFPAEVQVVTDPTEATQLPRELSTALPLRPRSSLDPDAGTEVREIDLAALRPSEHQRYRIRISGVGVSYPTQVSAVAQLKAYYVTARGMFHNRWAGDLREAYTEWSRPVDHGDVFTGEQANPFEMYPPDTPRQGQRQLVGGHHDAGDFDIRPTHTVVAQLLMRAYELDRERFPDRQLTIPESGNGIPDLLDEALWSIAGFSQLQESDGGVRAGAESHRHPPGIYFANHDPLPYWAFARNADVTARMAGVFAQASRLVQPFDDSQARDLRDRAERAWRYSTNHEAKAPFRLYAASELFRLTNDDQYKREFERLWSSFGPDGVFNAFALEHLSLSDYIEGQRAMPDYILGYLTSERASPALRQQAIRWLDQLSRDVVERTLASVHAHRNPRPDRSGFGWGQPTVMGRYMDPIFARLTLGELSDAQRQQYLDTLSVAADYVLGANPEGRVWITGLGSYAPERPLHLDSLAFLHEGRSAIPGIPVFGPVSELPGSYWYGPGRACFHPGFTELPPMRRYGDIRTFVNTNEFTIWETQAPHVAHFASLLGSVRQPPASWLPGQPDHRNPRPTGNAPEP